MSSARLELREVDKSLGGVEVLAGLSLHVEAGEFVSLLGPSGAGKSTALKLLIGELGADGGEVLSDGKPVSGRSARFGFMPQRDALMPWRSVIDNAILSLEVAGVKRAVARQRVRPLIDEFGLSGFEMHYPSQLSGGMRQRVALLRTVVHARDMLLLDEPFGALDALTRTEMQRWLESRWLQHHWTALLITHDVREAVFLSDRIYVLSARPARVICEITVPLPRPRHSDSLATQQAAAIETRVLDLLLNPIVSQRTAP